MPSESIGECGCAQWPDIRWITAELELAIGYIRHACGEPPPGLMTAKELEAMLKIDVKTIYSYVQRGLVPYVRIQSNVRFVKAQIIDWIRDHKDHNYRPRPMNGARRRLQ